MDRFTKNKDIPDDVKSFINRYSNQYGKAKLILKENRYFIEAVDKMTMRTLKEIDEVKQAIIVPVANADRQAALEPKKELRADVQ